MHLFTNMANISKLGLIRQTVICFYKTKNVTANGKFCIVGSVFKWKDKTICNAKLIITHGIEMKRFFKIF